ncbi:MAG: hypothetical protein COS37_06985 [Anaerolineae bacterium CG03_land_8_20_14_0_80_58_20]|nr:MAG: hypothetical protein COS37_06985 [Anaerolineae bacterium CG03_land_8_20_14_0_80_58_20]
MLPEPSQFLFVKMLYAGKVSTVPTTNFILKWIRNEVGAHKSDENLTEAEAEKIARIGIAQALATEEQVRAYGGPQFQVTQQVMQRFADAIQQGGMAVAPRILIKGSGRRHRRGQCHRSPDGDVALRQTRSRRRRSGAALA